MIYITNLLYILHIPIIYPIFIANQYPTKCANFSGLLDIYCDISFKRKVTLI